MNMVVGKKNEKKNTNETKFYPGGQIPEDVSRKIIDGAIASWKKNAGNGGVPLEEHIQKLKDYYSKNNTHIC